ncbi:MAG: hypothetical protein N3A61_01680, partial [Ignavibacteria bacterium]|nr:hypothetical protein [Ignavibacteria bacterium]
MKVEPHENNERSNSESSNHIKVMDFNKLNGINFARVAKLILNDLNSAKKTQVFFNKFKKEDVVNYLSNPQKFEKQLRQMSNFLYVVSSHYRRLVNYFAKLYLLDYIVDPVYINQNNLNINSFEKSYNSLCSYVENMNLKHELIKAQVCAWREDIFYGYVHQTKDSFFIQKLNPDFCQISGIIDGCYSFSFDFSYFKGENDAEFSKFSEEFKVLYTQYKDNASKRWIEINPENTICLKVNEDIEYPLVPFCSVFEALYDIQDYKALKKAKTAIGNYKMLAMVLPLSKEADSS